MAMSSEGKFYAGIALSIAMILVIPVTRSVTKVIEQYADAQQRILNNTGDLSEFLNKDPRGIRGTLANTNAILLQVGLAANELRIASHNQTEYWDQLNKRAHATLDKLDRIADNVEKTTRNTEVLTSAISQKIVPAAEEDLRSLNRLLTETTTLTQSLKNEAEETGIELRQAVKAVNDSVEQSNLPQMAQTANATVLHLEKSAANIEEATGYAKDMIKPKKKAFWRMAVESMLPIGIKVLIPQRTVISGTPTVTVKENK